MPLAVGPIYVGDVGHHFDVALERLDDDSDSATYGEIVAFDLSASGPLGAPTALQYIFIAPPDNTRTVETPSLVSAAGGTMRWTNDATTDFATAGRWRLQVVLTFATGEVFRSSVGTFTVEEAL